MATRSMDPGEDVTGEEKRPMEDDATGCHASRLAGSFELEDETPSLGHYRYTGPIIFPRCGGHNAEDSRWFNPRFPGHWNRNGDVQALASVHTDFSFSRWKQDMQMWFRHCPYYSPATGQPREFDPPPGFDAGENISCKEGACAPPE